MRVISRVPWLVLLAWPLVGCQQSQPLFVPSSQQSQMQRLQQQQLAAQQQQQSLQAAAASLDRVNAEKERQLAASRQDVQRLEAHVAALSGRLKDTAAEVVRERGERQALEKKYEDLVAASRRTGSVTITANSSRGVELSTVQIQGVDVRRDGDVVRVTLPGKQMFMPGTAQMTVGGGSALDSVGMELARAYPRQVIGVEGHTDNVAAQPAGGQDPLQFSTMRALAVSNYLAGRGSLRRDQLRVTGHGGSRPLYSNATADGREANQRVELVVYPDTVSDSPR